MGARVVFNIKQEDGNYICLYSHWGEERALSDAGKAIAKARPRWGDESYCARIIVSQIIGQGWDDEHNFGLWASTEPCTDETFLIIDLTSQTIEAVDGIHSFESFANYHTVLA